ncbi:MAG TPA: hypothetical protein VIU12_27330 [Chryseolinea sp.]
MKKINRQSKLLFFLYGMAILLFCHHYIIRPILLDWGAPQIIRELSLPGDTFTQGQHHTRAILVNATPEDLWPWLLQMGQDRAGFYSYQWLENLFGAGMKNTYEVKLEFQRQRRAGDTIWLASQHRWKAKGFQRVAEITPLRSYVMVGAEDYRRIEAGQKASGSWAFYLYPASATQTWLIARSSDTNISPVNKVLRYLAFEVPHAIMEIKMLKTLKRLGEGAHPVDNPYESCVDPLVSRGGTPILILINFSGKEHQEERTISTLYLEGSRTKFKKNIKRRWSKIIRLYDDCQKMGRVGIVLLYGQYAKEMSHQLSKLP